MPEPDDSTSAYCQARVRLSVKCLRKVQDVGFIPRRQRERRSGGFDSAASLQACGVGLSQHIQCIRKLRISAQRCVQVLLHNAGILQRLALRCGVAVAQQGQIKARPRIIRKQLRGLTEVALRQIEVFGLNRRIAERLMHQRIAGVQLFHVL